MPKSRLSHLVATFALASNPIFMHSLCVISRRRFAAIPSRHIRCGSTSFQSPRAAPYRPPGPGGEQAPRPPKDRTFLLLGTTLALCGGLLYIGLTTAPSKDPQPALNQHTFTPYTLTAKQVLSPTSAILTLAPPNTKTPQFPTFTSTPPSPQTNVADASPLPTSALWSIDIAQPALQIARAYTPLPHPSSHPSSATGPQTLRILVRREPQGELSRFLHGQALGSAVLVRGPRVEAELDADVKSVVCVVGGTGVAPGLQAAESVTASAQGVGRKVEVLWSSRRGEDCGGARVVVETGSGGLFGLGGKKAEEKVIGTEGNEIVRRLEELRDDGGVDVRYFVDEEKSFVRAGDIQEAMTRSTTNATDGRRVIVVSGPEGFIAHVAGARGPGEGVDKTSVLGGLLAGVDTKGWEVWKL
ncbi:hypothetical protein MRB53_038700 [Persea americana]|nr:hypothetical protein MRB53_038700 [Persea americana]